MEITTTPFATLQDREKMAGLAGVARGAKMGGSDVLNLILKLIGKGKSRAGLAGPKPGAEAAGYGAVMGGIGGAAGTGVSKAIRKATTGEWNSKEAGIVNKLGKGTGAVGGGLVGAGLGTLGGGISGLIISALMNRGKGITPQTGADAGRLAGMLGAAGGAAGGLIGGSLGADAGDRLTGGGKDDEEKDEE